MAPDRIRPLLRTLQGRVPAAALRTRRRPVDRNFRAAVAHPMANRIAQVRVPMLLARGQRGPVATRRWVQELRQIAPEAQLVEAPGAGHACHHGRPRAVADLIRGSCGLGRTEPAGR